MFHRYMISVTIRLYFSTAAVCFMCVAFLLLHTFSLESGHIRNKIIMENRTIRLIRQIFKKKKI